MKRNTPSMFKMIYSFFLKEWRRKTPINKMNGALLLIVLLGGTTYIFIFPWDLEKHDNDYYYDIIQAKSKEWKGFTPEQFKLLDKANVLLDLTNFQYLANVPQPTSYCALPSNKTGILLIMIVSLRRNTIHRELIRKTWGSLQKVTRWQIRLVFVLGGKSRLRKDSSDKLYESILTQEVEQRKDIIMGNFEEEYANRKMHVHMMSYKWALSYCSNAAFILKTTDYTFVDLFQIVEIASYTIPDNTLICRKINPSLQYKHGKVPVQLPEYCMPESMLASMDIVEQLYLLSSRFGDEENTSGTSESGDRFSKVRLMDDQVQITGYAANYLNIHITNIAHKVLQDPQAAFQWARNGKLGTDEKLPWIFVQLPDELDFYAKKEAADLWEKVTKVASLVYQFELSSRAKITDEIEKNFEKAQRKVIEH